MRERKRYADPTLRYTAGFGSPWRRASAAAIDWALCVVAYLVLSIPLGAVQALVAVSWREGDLGGLPGHVLVIGTQILTVAPTIAYFAFLLPTSHTLGMRARDIRIVSLRTGRAPSLRATFVRALLATVVAAAVYAVLSVATSVQGTDFNRTAMYELDVAYGIAAAAGVSVLLMAFSPTHRNVVDRLFGTAVVDELEAVVPVLGPWGPLNSFDLANERLVRRGP